ncbi:LRR receptor-like serine/threonine-protein kinase RGI5 [Cryptomeria japonica]|uniref:LRR receptor-like serine/threonine-protein kinase RGI5 n=1 Tax=Cryptomeria japonica TaxID=3369 RepID=UPI0027DA7873|nr:LRR receptor-like serine/threonine-protein kinase RGI5 [Cryptomeria japonica]
MQVNTKGSDAMVKDSVNVGSSADQAGREKLQELRAKSGSRMGCVSGAILANHSGMPIPSDLGKLKRLTFLSLLSGGFHGKTPATLANLWNLRHLELSSTDNVGKLQSPNLSVWLKNMTRLEHLNLHRVEISRAKERDKVITSLSNLRYLRLSDCGLTGLLPSSIKNLFRLAHLDLSSNSFTGLMQLPSLGQLPALSYLDLSSNKFNGTIPSTISKLVNLKSLLLSSNSFTGTISLSFFENMTILEQLLLSHNHLTVSVASTWTPKFKKLSGLGLASCKLFKFPLFLVKQYHMFELDLSGNSIAGNIPTWIWEFPELFHLNLSSSELTGRLPLKLAAKNLGFLDLHNNSLEGAVPLPPASILYLDMSDNNFTGSIPGDITTYLQSADVFSILRNKTSGRIPDSICTTTMRVLDLAGNKLSGTIPLNFTANCSDLRVLSLGQNNLVGDMPEVGDLTKLQMLSLNGNHLQGLIESSVENCTSLQVPNLGNNHCDGSIPHWIGNLSKLQILMLNSNKFQGTIPPKIFALKQLQILDLSHNNLSGSIPTSLTGLQAMVNASQFSPVQLGYRISKDILCKNEVTLSTKYLFLEYEIILTIFKFIDLSSNNLSGRIPPDIGSLQGLKGLNLSRNNLIGKIPEKFGGMDQLESLDLSLNNLSGNIPLELQYLSYLHVFNVSL